MSSIALIVGVLVVLYCNNGDALKIRRSQSPNKATTLHQATVVKDVAAVATSPSSFANGMTANNFKLNNPPVYIFGKAQVKSTKSPAESVSLLGGKGANLAVMGDIGLSVPPGFTITTEVCMSPIFLLSFAYLLFVFPSHPFLLVVSFLLLHQLSYLFVFLCAQTNSQFSTRNFFPVVFSFLLFFVKLNLPYFYVSFCA